MKNFVIKKNAHGSKIWGFLPHIGFTFKEKITFECKFDKNCIYTIDGVDKWDINKLYGISTSYYHHKQSARVGWRCMDGQNIELLTYCYDKGERITEVSLGKVAPDEIFKCSINVEKDHFTFIFECKDKHKVVMVKKEQKSWDFKYKLYPYFGGNQKSPQKMNIYLKEL